MTFPALSIEAEFMSIGVISHQFAVGKKFRVTSYAVFVNYLPTGLMNEDYLRFEPESKHCSMPEAVLRLEVILVKYVIVGHMAVVAVCLLAVRTMVPCGILRSHNMTVHAGLGLVAKV